MLQFAANLTLLYPDCPFLERFARAAESGFRAVEFQLPYAFSHDEVAQAAFDAGLRVVLFNLPSGDWQHGERGIAVLPDRMGEFRDGVTQAIAYAQRLDCDRLNCLAGIRPTGLSQDEADRVLVENLTYAADQLARVGRRLMVEPVNTFDIPGFHLSTTAHTLRVLDQVNRPNVFIQYDIYHMQRMQGELVGTFERLQSRIGHIQIADTPGRHEPGTGEIAYDFVFRALEEHGYDGWIGLEYNPAGVTEEGLHWLGQGFGK